MRHSIRRTVQLILASAALGAAGDALAATQITHVVVLFQENVSFDHYFGTYPNAQNNSGEQAFFAYPGTPSVNGLTPALLTANPNLNAGGSAKVNPPRLSPSQAYTCSQNHSYGPEQQAVNGGLMDQFPKFTGRTTSEGCAADGSTVLGYYDGNTVAAYWNYAQNFALSDNSFGSTFGPSTPGAINLISGQTYGGLTHFGIGSTNSFPNSVSVAPAAAYTGTATGTPVSDIGDFDAYLDDCGTDAGGTVKTTTTLEMNGDSSAVTGNKNIGDLLNAAGVTWGWFQGGFRALTPAVLNADGSTATAATCSNSSTTAQAGGPVVSGGRVAHQYPSNAATVFVPNPNGSPLLTGADVHTWTADYVSHHEPFQFYASTRNPHHLPPTSTAAIGTADQANHQYDTRDFIAALQNGGNIPAVSFIKAPAAYNGHPGNSDPTTEQYWITQIVNQIMQSPAWATTAIIIAYDDSDGWYDHVTGPVVSPSKVSNSSAGVVTSGSNSANANTYDNYAGAGNCGTPVSGAQQARCGHGPRLPVLVISPYANANYVDHALTNQASILKFIETNWGLGFIDGSTPPAVGTGSFDRNSGAIDGMLNLNALPNTASFLLSCSGAVVDATHPACPLDPTP